jgi:hypothetical protein
MGSNSEIFIIFLSPNAGTVQVIATFFQFSPVTLDSHNHPAIGATQPIQLKSIRSDLRTYQTYNSK